MPRGVLISLIIIAAGIAWLLNTLEVLPGVNWIWTLVVAAGGMTALTWGKINKLSFVMGNFLLVAAMFSIMRQVGSLRGELEVPMLVVIFGVLFLVAQHPKIPHTAAVAQMKEESAKQKPAK